MDGQLLLTSVAIALALLYLGRRMLRTWRSRGPGCGGCSCSASTRSNEDTTSVSTLIPIEQVKLRRR